MKDLRKTADIVYRELAINITTLQRMTGFRPRNPKAKVEDIRFYKYFFTALIIIINGVVTIPFIIAPAQTSSSNYTSALFIMMGIELMFIPLLFFAGILAPIGITMVHDDHIGNILRIMGYTEDEIRRVSAMVIFKTMDTAIYGAVVIPLIASIILKNPAPVITAIQSICIAMIFYRPYVINIRATTGAGFNVKYLSSSILSNLAYMVVFLVFVVLADVFAHGIPKSLIPILSFIPFLNNTFMTMNTWAAVMGIIYTVLLVLAAVKSLQHISTRLLAPKQPNALLMSIRSVYKRIKFRGFIMGMMRLYMVSIIKNRIFTSMFSWPIFMVLTLAIQTLILPKPSQMSTNLLMVMQATAFLITITESMMLPALLYSIDAMGLNVMVTLPISPRQRLLAKLPTVALLYLVTVLPMYLLIMWPIITTQTMWYSTALFLSSAITIPMAVTAVMAVMHERENKARLKGEGNMLKLGIITVVVSLTAALPPIIAYWFMYIVTAKPLQSALILALTSALEFTISITLLKPVLPYSPKQAAK